MNIYFLVEGKSTERKVYPAWLAYLLPELKRVDDYCEVVKNNYYLFSADGYPSIIHHHLPNAIIDIQENGNYNYLVVCLDADEVSYDYRKQEVIDYLKFQNIHLGNIQLIVIIQNRCFETWFLGNRKIYSRQPQSTPLLDYIHYYDISANCPELMGKYYNFNTHAQFHENYLKELFKAKKIIYSKNKPGEVVKQYYLEQLLLRIQDKKNDLLSFQDFINFCILIKSKLLI
ncbi:hypothetical protein [Nostoc sp. CALU 1950]|uniref:hypothetical protein n=1 Tax=Nostoc sp. CALU 1950 TaxID=3104321 RepID=UPI003EBC5797